MDREKELDRAAHKLLRMIERQLASLPSEERTKRKRVFYAVVEKVEQKSKQPAK